jgi:two-component system sensor histidine kinase GlrK
MLAGFLLIALLLGWVAIRSWLLLEQFVERNQQGNEQALQLSASIQELADRSIDLERSARQFMVIGNAGLLGRFDENVARAMVAVDHLEAIPGEFLGQSPGDWRRTVGELARSVHQSPPPVALTALFSRLAEINGELAHKGRRWIDTRNAEVLAELDASRLRLASVLATAVAGAFLVALAMSWWLSRPVGALERAIARLGESRFDETVTVRGPADLRVVGRRLDWLRRRLADLEAEREQTLRHVSHELKTPLTALREGIALLQEQVVGPLDGTQREVVEILQHNVMTLQGHIESLLRLNAAAFDARRLRYRPVHLGQLLAEVVRGRELQIQARRLSVFCDAPAGRQVLDGEKLQVAVDNLLSNAIDFSPEGGAIWLTATLSGEVVNIACLDQGAGVAEEDAERIFEPFVQGRRAAPAPRQGSGVGLSIVRELATAMGGRVQLIPGQASGANFQIEVPRAA